MKDEPIKLVSCEDVAHQHTGFEGMPTGRLTALSYTLQGVKEEAAVNEIYKRYTKYHRGYTRYVRRHQH